MPWHPEDAEKHTKKANTPEKQRQWATVANAALVEYNGDEEKAIKVANASMNKRRFI